MSRLFVPLAVLACFPFTLLADDPRPPRVEKAISVQQAMAAAREHLTAGRTAEAVAVLEPHVSDIDGNKTFLQLLGDAYAAELRRVETSATPDTNRAAELRKALNLLGRTVPKSEAPPASLPPLPTDPAPAAVVSERDPLADARALFQQQKFAEAADRFSAANARGAEFKPDEFVAWAYCRVKAASVRVNAPNCDPATAATLEKEVAEALRLAPNHAELQRSGNAVLLAARQKAGGKPAPFAPPTAAPVPTPDGWDVVETASFRVRHRNNRALAESVANAAEAKRKETFEKWSGPAGGPWAEKCVVFLHPTAADYARSTGKPAEGTGHATVKLTDGRASERRIDLRADDAGAVSNALPRELTHVVLADLFPDRPPPKWAEEGMAVLAGSPEEVGRFTAALPRCAQRGELFAVAALLELKDVPGEKVAGFYCESVSLVDYLVKLRGARAFTIFLRDVQRYELNSALKRTYSIDTPQQLEAAWKQATLDATR